MSEGSIAIEEIERAAAVLAPDIVRTPLVELELDVRPGRVFLKLENLQPIGSFKLRGALNALERLGSEAKDGVVTASAGNMAQGVAWAARRRGIPCAVVMPEGAPQTKRDAVERLGGRVVEVAFERWWRAIEEESVEEIAGAFVHPVQDEAVMAGNGTIGLEIADELPDVDAVLVPFGAVGSRVALQAPSSSVCQTQRSTRSSRARAPHVPEPSRPASLSPCPSSARSSTERARVLCSPACGHGCDLCSTGRSP